MDPALASTKKVPMLLISGDNNPLRTVSVLDDSEKIGEGSKVVIF